MAVAEIQELEREIYELTIKLNEMRKSNSGEPVDNYTFTTLAGETSLEDMFVDKARANIRVGETGCLCVPAMSAMGPECVKTLSLI